MDNPFAGKRGGASGKPARKESPTCTFVIALVVIFLGELGIMRVLAFFSHHLSPPPYRSEIKKISM